MAQENCEKYAYLDQLSTQQLEQLLLADTEDPSGRDTSEVVFHILEVLQTREDVPAMEPVDVAHAWEEFQQYYNTPEGEGQSLYLPREDSECPEKDACAASKFRSRLPALWKTARIVAATVAILLSLMVGAQASGLNVFGTLAQWTNDIFHFGVDKDSGLAENYKLFLDLLEEHDIPRSYAPSQYPSDFIASEPTFRSDDFGFQAEISFSNTENTTFHISFARYSSPIELEHGTFEKDNTKVEPYLSHNKLFYIFSNTDFILATWADGVLSESIWGDISSDDIKSMIDSIGGS